MVVIGCSLNTNTNKDCDTSRRLGCFDDDDDDVGALTFWVQIILQSCVIQMNCYHFVHPVRSFKMHEMRLSKATMYKQGNFFNRQRGLQILHYKNCYSYFELHVNATDFFLTNFNVEPCVK